MLLPLAWRNETVEHLADGGEDLVASDQTLLTRRTVRLEQELILTVRRHVGNAQQAEATLHAVQFHFDVDALLHLDEPELVGDDASPSPL